FHGSGSGAKRFLKMEYYSRLIEWQELQEARKSAQHANTHSWIAILLSVLAIGISVWFGWQQLERPIELGKKTIALIKG
ncbi:MAG: hypothetical protein L6Q57_00680, partial [Alphaproteobacteria bacterium]|nr:hypothetical protein [Alphaproteobacteria bacterium]